MTENTFDYNSIDVHSAYHHTIGIVKSKKPKPEVLTRHKEEKEKHKHSLGDSFGYADKI